MRNWWENAVVYQIYPKSFQDSNEDGIGDLQGIIQRLDYVKKLGIDAIWLNPIFISPQIDDGYDVANYDQIDPIFGTEADAEALLVEAHKRGIKVIFDFVMNHTSDQHPWFQEALKGPDNPYRDYYLWQKAADKQELPTNWASFFGGSVWEKEPNGSDYYFHLFAKEMPDLNWENPEVRQAIFAVACYWAEKGIDGWRLDAFIHLEKADFQQQLDLEPGKIGLAEEYYANLPKVHEYMHEFSQKLKAKYPEIFIVGEAASADLSLAQGYTDPAHVECDTVITFRYFPETTSQKDPRLPANFQPAPLDWTAFKEEMQQWQTKLGHERYPTLYWNNHDMARMVSRFGDEEHHRAASQKMLATLMYLQKGIPFLLFGEEIGMKNLLLDEQKLVYDSQEGAFYQNALMDGYSKEATLKMLNQTSKLASRGAMQWNEQAYSGFSTVQPWSGVNVEPIYNAAAQVADRESIFHYYKKLLALKHQRLFQKGKWTYVDFGKSFYSYRRSDSEGQALVICNITNSSHTIEVGFAITQKNVLLANEELNIKNAKTIELPAYGAIVLKQRG